MILIGLLNQGLKTQNLTWILSLKMEKRTDSSMKKSDNFGQVACHSVIVWKKETTYLGAK